MIFSGGNGYCVQRIIWMTLAAPFHDFLGPVASSSRARGLSICSVHTWNRERNWICQFFLTIHKSLNSLKLQLKGTVSRGLWCSEEFIPHFTAARFSDRVWKMCFWASFWHRSWRKPAKPLQTAFRPDPFLGLFLSPSFHCLVSLSLSFSRCDPPVWLCAETLPDLIKLWAD